MCGLRILVLVAVTGLLSSSNPPDVRAAPTYTRKVKIDGPVELTRANLLAILERGKKLTDVANAGLPCKYGGEKLTIERDGEQMSITGPLGSTSTFGAPEKATTVRYSLECHDDQAPIAGVSISLLDIDRELEVSGSSQDQVVSISRTIRQDFEPYVGLVGGAYGRMGFGFGTVGLVMFAMIGNIWVKHRRLNRVLTVMPPIVLLAIFIPVWKDVFPGFVLHSADAGFFSRNNAIISGWGALFGLSLGAVGLWFSIRPKAPGVAPTAPTPTTVIAPTPATAPDAPPATQTGSAVGDADPSEAKNAR